MGYFSTVPFMHSFLTEKSVGPHFGRLFYKLIWDRFFVHFFRGISWKNDFSKLFPRKIQFFSNIFGGKFSAENSAELSPEKMYEKSAPGHPAHEVSFDQNLRKHQSLPSACAEPLGEKRLLSLKGKKMVLAILLLPAIVGAAASASHAWIFFDKNN
jgi:hypothetical protein